MNILIIGSTGMLGGTIKKYSESIGFKVNTFNRSNIDLANCSFEELQIKLGGAITDNSIQVVINCSGAIKHRKNFSTTDMIKVNSIIPHWLSKICDNHSANFIHFTTDCVFDGQKGGYVETDLHNATDDYGKTKSLGEPEKGSTIRTSIIGEEERNKLSLLEWVKSNKGGTISGYKNHIWNGVTCLQMAKILEKIINEKRFWIGVRHIYSSEVTKFDLVSMVNEIYDLGISINSTLTKDGVDRSLSSLFIETFKIPHLYKQIEETKSFHENIKNKQLQQYYKDAL